MMTSAIVHRRVRVGDPARAVKDRLTRRGAGSDRVAAADFDRVAGDLEHDDGKLPQPISLVQLGGHASGVERALACRDGIEKGAADGLFIGFEAP